MLLIENERRSPRGSQTKNTWLKIVIFVIIIIIIIFFFKICLLINTLNNYIYKTHTKNTLTRDINRVKQKKIVKLLQEVLQG